MGTKNLLHGVSTHSDEQVQPVHRGQPGAGGSGTFYRDGTSNNHNDIDTSGNDLFAVGSVRGEAGQRDTGVSSGLEGDC